MDGIMFMVGFICKLVNCISYKGNILNMLRALSYEDTCIAIRVWDSCPTDRRYQKSVWCMPIVQRYLYHDTLSIVLDTRMLRVWLMANVGEPRSSNRRLIMSITYCILLYGANIWADALRKEWYRKWTAAVQRRSAPRIACSYRTVSETAVLMIAGVAHIDLLARQCKEIYERRIEISKAQAQTEAKRQERWRNNTRGRWTARLIPYVTPWVDRQYGEVHYHLTQFLSGHGLFRSYLHKMRKKGNPFCIYSDASKDDAHHIFFDCKRWEIERPDLVNAIGQVTLNTITGVMLVDERKWTVVTTFVKKILRQKEEEEDTLHRHYTSNTSASTMNRKNTLWVAPITKKMASSWSTAKAAKMPA